MLRSDSEREIVGVHYSTSRGHCPDLMHENVWSELRRKAIFCVHNG